MAVVLFSKNLLTLLSRLQAQFQGEFSTVGLFIFFSFRYMIKNDQLSVGAYYKRNKVKN